MLEKEILKKIKEKNILKVEEEEIIKKYIEYFVKSTSFNINTWDKNDYLDYINNNITNHYEKIEGLEEGVKLFSNYLKEKKKILIITDNDFDGTSIYSQALFTKRFLDNKFNNINYFNIMYSYGGTHGITYELVNDYMNNVDEEILIITADNGINNKEEIEKIKEKYKKVKIIVTDHHLVNKNTGVFGLVDVVINSESVDENQTKSKVLELENGEKTAISGGYTFYILLKYTLNNIGVKNIKLIEDLEKIALMSQIGDIINFGRDHVTKLKYYEEEMINLCIVDRIINDQDMFNKFKNKEDNILKIKDYIQKSISTINASRRMNSILFEFHKNKDIEGFLKKEFNFEEEEDIKILKELENRSETVRNYLFNEWQKDLCSFTAIKEMAAISLWPLDNLKEQELTIVKEAGDIIIGLNRIKNSLRKNLIDKDLYEHKDYGGFEVFRSKIGQKLREILSIQVFIESQKTKPFLNLAYENEVLRGSMRSQNGIPFKKEMLEDKEIEKIKEETEINIEIVGHENAAGFIFVDIKEEPETLLERVENFLIKSGKVIEDKNFKIEKEEYIDISFQDYIEVDPIKIHKILNTFLYTTNHPFMQQPKLRFETEDFIEINGPIKMKTSKKGNLFYINKIKNKKKQERVQVSYFGEEGNIEKSKKILGNIELKEEYKTKQKYYQIIIEEC
jgi:single-stranded DNA-specific DHH superfamily exonuclease